MHTHQAPILMQKNKGYLDLLPMSVGLTVDMAIRVTEPEQLYSKSPQRHIYKHSK